MFNTVKFAVWEIIMCVTQLCTWNYLQLKRLTCACVFPYPADNWMSADPGAALTEAAETPPCKF